jgi:hypothetical protein
MKEQTTATGLPIHNNKENAKRHMGQSVEVSVIPSPLLA